VSGEGAREKYRLFFAVWPSTQMQTWLADVGRDLQRELGGRATQPDSIHLTLVFLGDVVAARFDDVRALGDAVHCERFTLDIDTRGCWTHNRIAWAAPSTAPQALADLVSQLQTRVRDLGFEIDARPYAPHITLVRKAERGLRTEALAAPARWPVVDFVLVSSQLAGHGSRYKVVSRWACRGDAAAT
jgi:2'-5' RNA ligase